MARAADPKAIRLRNELITTAASAKVVASLQAQAENPEKPVSGLHLIQFTEPIQPAWREQLEALNVTLVRYVPDDAFVADFQGVSLLRVKALPFVHWIGEYRAAHKLHSRLAEILTQQPARFSVRVLLAPNPSDSESARVRPSVGRLQREVRSRFGSVLEVEVSTEQLEGLANSPAVLWIEPAPRMKLLDEVSSKIVGGGVVQLNSSAAEDTNSSSMTNSHATLTQQLGFDGRGVTVAIADSGLHNGDFATMHPDLAGRVDAFFFYGQLGNAADQHGHGTHAAGIIAGDGSTGEQDSRGARYGLGLAPKAHMIAQRLFDDRGQYEPPASLGLLTRDAVRAGAIIGSNSWGEDTQGRYDLSAHEFDALVRDADPDTPGDQPYILIFAAGNAGPGPQSIASPAVAKNVIAIGASQNNRFGFILYDDGQEAMADFSSRGPSEDGRIKPDLIAPGTWIASLQSESATDANGWSPISPRYQYQGGTSQAAPHAAGAAAVFVQYYRETQPGLTPSPALVKAALINSAADSSNAVGGTDAIPNLDEGWGRVNLTGIIGSRRRYAFVDQTQSLATGQVHEHRVAVMSADEPLKVTLTYTDVPGLPSAIPALVNDLDLEVIASDGSVYHGNQFEAGASVPGAPAFDTLNNVEAVHLFAPIPGEYVVRVRARNIPEDARRNTAAVDQDFALVLSGDFPPAGTAVVIFDRPAYAAPASIVLKVIDGKLAGQAAIQVRVTSTTEPNGELVSLRPFGAAGVFTGSVATETGPAVADGRLQIAHGDPIRARYQEGPVTRTTEARADLLPPLITNVIATNRYGRTVVQWRTDEPAKGKVWFGTNSNLTLSATNAAFTTDTEIELNSLAPGATYQFVVQATDRAGNSVTNDNSGRGFPFVPVPAKTLLLVNAYTVTDPFAVAEIIPVTAYTRALDRIGVSYEVWDVLARGLPLLKDVLPFRVLMWRLNDNIKSTDTLSQQPQELLQTYLNGGGSVFLSSMQLLTRLGEHSTFRTNVLHVRSFLLDAGIPNAKGVDSDPVSSGMALELDYSPFYTDVLQFVGKREDMADPLLITTNAVPILFDSSARVAGLRYPKTGQDSPGRLVFLPFPLEAVPENTLWPNNRAGLLHNALGFLAPSHSGFGTLALDSSEYTIPSLITVEVGDADLAGKTGPAVRVFSDTATNGVTVALSETVRRGLFRGFVTVVHPTNAPSGQEQLRAQGGDFIRAEYFDASANGLISATAIVDTQVPAIDTIQIVPAYETATVSWRTSKPTDALVQFGESPLLSRTAYAAAFEDTHRLTLVGLMPDRVYYCRIVSRDTAGNTAVADNTGDLHTFRTLRPFSAAFVENFDRGANTNWLVVSGGIENTATPFPSDAAWEIGVPDNGLQTKAASPPNAWGSNLQGQPIALVDTDLISPAIDLSGGNTATLRFSHSYDFTRQADAFEDEFGRVLVSTDNGASWTSLREYKKSSDWIEETLDLTSFLDRIIRVRWHYELFAFDAAPRPGWLVDDVSVTVTNIVRGAIQITNNLAQASFTLSGAITQSGKGVNLTIASAPVGSYTIRFHDVPFYVTPPPQTNTLGTNATLTLRGNYSFPDTNQNGISDLWERRYWNTVSPARTRDQDTDQDRATDYAEFIAGTDPTEAGSILEVSSVFPLPNGGFRVAWEASPGRDYRVLRSGDLVIWSAVSSWTRASSTSGSLTLPPLSPTASSFYRLEVRP